MSVAFEANERPEAAPSVAAKAASPAEAARASADFTRLYVSVRRAAEVRPGDLVGAITGEAGLPGGDIGAIEIADRQSRRVVPATAGFTRCRRRESTSCADLTDRLRFGSYDPLNCSW